MIGIIVTGHGRFAEGLASSIDLIAGPQENFVAVNFEHEVDELTEDLTKVIESLKECEGIIVFSDLAGGSPFKTAVILAQAYENIEIIAGTNLPMLAEIVMARTFGMDLAALTDMAVNTGKEQITRFDISSMQTQDNEDNDFEDGI